jgi:hypothetical protein
MTHAIKGTKRRGLRGVFGWVVVVVLASLFSAGLAACSDVKDAISFIEYIEATGDVLDANGMEPEVDIDCDGSTDAKEVTCTGQTIDGQSIESRGEDLGEDTATLVVTVDGEILYDGLLKDAGNS